MDDVDDLFADDPEMLALLQGGSGVGGASSAASSSSSSSSASSSSSSALPSRADVVDGVPSAVGRGGRAVRSRTRRRAGESDGDEFDDDEDEVGGRGRGSSSSSSSSEEGTAAAPAAATGRARRARAGIIDRFRPSSAAMPTRSSTPPLPATGGAQTEAAGAAAAAPPLSEEAAFKRAALQAVGGSGSREVLKQRTEDVREIIELITNGVDVDAPELFGVTKQRYAELLAEHRAGSGAFARGATPGAALLPSASPATIRGVASSASSALAPPSASPIGQQSALPPGPAAALPTFEHFVPFFTRARVGEQGQEQGQKKAAAGPAPTAVHKSPFGCAGGLGLSITDDAPPPPSRARAAGAGAGAGASSSSSSSSSSSAASIAFPTPSAVSAIFLDAVNAVASGGVGPSSSPALCALAVATAQVVRSAGVPLPSARGGLASLASAPIPALHLGLLFEAAAAVTPQSPTPAASASAAVGSPGSIAGSATSPGSAVGSPGWPAASGAHGVGVVGGPLAVYRRAARLVCDRAGVPVGLGESAPAHARAVSPAAQLDLLGSMPYVGVGEGYGLHCAGRIAALPDRCTSEMGVVVGGGTGAFAPGGGGLYGRWRRARKDMYDPESDVWTGAPRLASAMGGRLGLAEGTHAQGLERIARARAWQAEEAEGGAAAAASSPPTFIPVSAFFAALQALGADALGEGWRGTAASPTTCPLDPERRTALARLFVEADAHFKPRTATASASAAGVRASSSPSPGSPPTSPTAASSPPPPPPPPPPASFTVHSPSTFSEALSLACDALSVSLAAHAVTCIERKGSTAADGETAGSPRAASLFSQPATLSQAFSQQSASIVTAGRKSGGGAEAAAASSSSSASSSWPPPFAYTDDALVALAAVLLRLCVDPVVAGPGGVAPRRSALLSQMDATTDAAPSGRTGGVGFLADVAPPALPAVLRLLATACDVLAVHHVLRDGKEAGGKPTQQQDSVQRPEKLARTDDGATAASSSTSSAAAASAAGSAAASAAGSAATAAGGGEVGSTAGPPWVGCDPAPHPAAPVDPGWLLPLVDVTLRWVLPSAFAVPCPTLPDEDGVEGSGESDGRTGRMETSGPGAAAMAATDRGLNLSPSRPGFRKGPSALSPTSQARRAPSLSELLLPPVGSPDFPPVPVPIAGPGAVWVGRSSCQAAVATDLSAFGLWLWRAGAGAIGAVIQVHEAAADAGALQGMSRAALLLPTSPATAGGAPAAIDASRAGDRQRAFGQWRTGIITGWFPAGMWGREGAGGDASSALRGRVKGRGGKGTRTAGRRAGPPRMRSGSGSNSSSDVEGDAGMDMEGGDERTPGGGGGDPLFSSALPFHEIAWLDTLSSPHSLEGNHVQLVLAAHPCRLTSSAVSAAGALRGSPTASSSSSSLSLSIPPSASASSSSSFSGGPLTPIPTPLIHAFVQALDRESGSAWIGDGWVEVGATSGSEGVGADGGAAAASSSSSSSLGTAGARRLDAWVNRQLGFAGTPGVLMGTASPARRPERDIVADVAAAVDVVLDRWRAVCPGRLLPALRSRADVAGLGAGGAVLTGTLLAPYLVDHVRRALASEFGVAGSWGAEERLHGTGTLVLQSPRSAVVAAAAAAAAAAGATVSATSSSSSSLVSGGSALMLSPSRPAWGRLGLGVVAPTHGSAIGAAGASVAAAAAAAGAPTSSSHPSRPAAAHAYAPRRSVLAHAHPRTGALVSLASILFGAVSGGAAGGGRGGGASGWDPGADYGLLPEAQLGRAALPTYAARLFATKVRVVAAAEEDGGVGMGGGALAAAGPVAVGRAWYRPVWASRSPLALLARRVAYAGGRAVILAGDNTDARVGTDEAARAELVLLTAAREQLLSRVREIAEGGGKGAAAGTAASGGAGEGTTAASLAGQRSPLNRTSMPLAPALPQGAAAAAAASSTPSTSAAPIASAGTAAASASAASASASASARLLYLLRPSSFVEDNLRRTFARMATTPPTLPPGSHHHAGAHTAMIVAHWQRVVAITDLLSLATMMLWAHRAPAPPRDEWESGDEDAGGMEEEEDGAGGSAGKRKREGPDRSGIVTVWSEGGGVFSDDRLVPSGAAVGWVPPPPPSGVGAAGAGGTRVRAPPALAPVPLTVRPPAVWCRLMIRYDSEAAREMERQRSAAKGDGGGGGGAGATASARAAADGGVSFALDLWESQVRAIGEAPVKVAWGRRVAALKGVLGVFGGGGGW
jgi:trimeric autotransporter adhesin